MDGSTRRKEDMNRPFIHFELFFFFHFKTECGNYFVVGNDMHKAQGEKQKVEH